MTEVTESGRRAIADARALLATLIESGWSEIHVASGDTEIFIARAGGRANPMRMVHAAAMPVETAGPAATVSAPHVATFVDALPVGSPVEQGARVATLSVLDDRFDVAAPVSGTVTAHHPKAGAMVEFDDPIVEIRPRAA